MLFQYNGQDIGWNHTVQVYEWDLNEKSQSYGLRVLNKLTEDHIKLTPRLRMKVKLAAQVLKDFFHICWGNLTRGGEKIFWVRQTWRKF